MDHSSWNAALNAAARPLALLVFFGAAGGIAWLLDRIWPDGRVKRFLFKKRYL